VCVCVGGGGEIGGKEADSELSKAVTKFCIPIAGQQQRIHNTQYTHTCSIAYTKIAGRPLFFSKVSHNTILELGGGGVLTSPRRNLLSSIAPTMPTMVMRKVMIPATMMITAPEKKREPVKKSRLEPVCTR
jgi:hypothetical protein